ncbi:MAG: tetratricopeptide repeat-containing sulfotransferase family protein, partial [Geminicoccales bacterium]
VITDPAAPADPRALCAAGVELHAAGRYEEAIAFFRQAIALDPGLAEAHDRLGRSLNNLQRLDEAAAAFRESVRLEPGSAEAHNHLGHVLRAQGVLEGAAASFSEALRIAPDFARAHHNLGTVRNEQGRAEDAVECFRRGLEIERQDAAGWTNLGDLLHALDRHDEAVTAYRRAIAENPRFADAHVRLGGLLWDRGKLPGAMDCYRAALDIEPAHGAALAGMAGVMEVDGRYAEALALIEPFMTGQPGEALVVAHARLLRRLGRGGEAIERLRNLIAATDERSGKLVRAHFAVADMYDEEGDYERAFAHYRAANSARRPGFDPQGFAAGVESLIGFFTPATFEELPRSRNVSERPVFIIGMPRSGTSLVEQILAAHSAVHACGERNDLYALAREMSERLGSRAPYPNCLRKATEAKLTEFADEYLERSGASEAGILRVTDKLPTNFFNLGLIGLLFPRARIIHCRRHPLDTGLSCYFQHFASRGLAFTDRLEHIAVYTNLYRRIMAHWRRVSGLPLLDIDYEDLVAQPEAVARRMIAFLGLEWEPACLRFHELGRRVVTASFAQVREPIYRRSIGRHRHYAAYVGPLRDGLEEPGTP